MNVHNHHRSSTPEGRSKQRTFKIKLKSNRSKYYHLVVDEVSEYDVGDAKLAISLSQSPLSMFKVDLAHPQRCDVLIASLPCGLGPLMSRQLSFL